jgi:hypothetical protein
VIEPDDPVMLGGFAGRPVQMPGRGCIEGIVDQGRLARSGNAGDAGEETDRDVDRDVLQVVAAGANDLQQPLAVGLPPLAVQADAAAAGQVVAGQ